MESGARVHSQLGQHPRIDPGVKDRALAFVFALEQMIPSSRSWIVKAARKVSPKVTLFTPGFGLEGVVWVVSENGKMKYAKHVHQRFRVSCKRWTPPLKPLAR
jgi:hypothetical protein